MTAVQVGARRCQGCGGPLDRRAVRVCRTCWHAGATRGRAEIIAAIQRWAKSHDGNPPTSMDWNVGMARRVGHWDRVIEYAAGDWPAASTVVKHFGKWNAAIAAAGFVPNPPGPNVFARKPRGRGEPTPPPPPGALTLRRPRMRGAAPAPRVDVALRYDARRDGTPFEQFVAQLAVAA